MHGFPTDFREIIRGNTVQPINVDPGVVSGKLGRHFLAPDLLRRALTHRSYGATHNERLEFLGDSIVNCIIALELYEKFPDLSEGDLSRLRANLVNQQSLHGIALNLQLGEHLLLGEGELKSGGAQRISILADAIEAIVGAVMLDGGFEAARNVVRHLFADSLATIDPTVSGKDAKTLLQELLQGKGMALPIYTVIGTQGQAHAQIFHVCCDVEILSIRTEGQGSSRRAAEQDAAQKAYALADTP